jgi:diguanylate cyclase (GGDEF)-like protein/PAS domain S-box-containing protein
MHSEDRNRAIASDRSMSRPGLLSGWAGLALLRLGLAVVIAVHALSYRPPPDHPQPDYVEPAAIAVAVGLAMLALIQLTRGKRFSRRLAVVSFVVDALALFGVLSLYAFDPRLYLLALVVVVQAEGGVVLGLSWGLVAWAATSAGYVAVEFLSAGLTGGRIQAAEVAVRIGAGLLLSLGGGFMSDELSGERQRRQAEREQELGRLQEAEARYRSLVEQLPVVTYVDAVDPSSSTLFISPQIQEVAGYSPQEWITDPQLWRKLLHPSDRARALAENERTNATGEPFKIEYRLRTRDGRTVWIRDEAVLVRDRRGRPQYWQGVMVDITERKLAEEEVTYLAYHDKLTGLPNRPMFERVLDLSLARARRKQLAVAVLYMDLDNFKEVNDTLGHATGDELLRQVAARLTSAVRATDVVARQGGDEFLVLLADLDLAGGEVSLGALALAEAVTERIHDAFGPPFTLGGQEFSVTASIGVSYFPVTAEDADALMKQADAAMYRSKRTTPGSTAFAEEKS